MEKLKQTIEEIVNLYKSKEFFKAEKLSKETLINNKGVSFLYNLTGLILTSQNKHDEAINYYEDGIKIEPNNAVIYNNIANSHKSLGKILEAENYYKKSILVKNNFIEAHNNLGNLYKDLNKIDQAKSCYKKAITINPKFYIGYYNLAILFKSIGDFKEAKIFLKKTISLNNKFYSAHRAYSQINKYKKDDEHLKEMTNLYKNEKKDLQGKNELSFSLSKAYDDIGDYKTSFKYLYEGNNLRKKNINFSLDNVISEFQGIKNFFSKNSFLKNKNFSYKTAVPIFIVGMPRSGTTLIEQIISSHSSVFPGDELNYFNDLIKKYFYNKKKFDINYLINLNDNTFKTIGQDYLNKINKISNNAKKVTDKLPINFKWIGFINLIFPEAKIVHCIRNSKDTCVSIYKNYFTNPELNYAYNVNDLVNFFNLYGDLMNFWKNKFPNSIIEIKYENLINNPNVEIKNLIKSCDLPWDKNCLKFYNNKRLIKTASDTQARKKIYKSSLNSWKNYEKFLRKDLIKLKY